MNTHTKFSEFNTKVRLNPAKRDKLKTNRSALRERVKRRLNEEGLPVPKFHSQGSFPLQTNVNPIRTKDEDGETIEEYDLDDGVYFFCDEADREAAETYHERLLAAVTGHTKSAESKTSCVRVYYSDGHHVDLPVYWMADENSIPELGRPGSGYSESDPKSFQNWVEAEIGSTAQVGQLRRNIRYLKAWKNFRETEDRSVDLPPGVTLTILACKHYVESDRDDESFRLTCKGMRDALSTNFFCTRPTTPTGEDMLKDFCQSHVLQELDDLVKTAEEAENAITEKSACEKWREVFGDRFPAGSSVKSDPGESEDRTAPAHKPWSRS